MRTNEATTEKAFLFVPSASNQFSGNGQIQKKLVAVCCLVEITSD
jgi:hypothetical protein